MLTKRRARQLSFSEPPYPNGEVRPVEDLEDLSRVRTPSLVLAQEGDDLHTVAIARTLAASLPNANLQVLPTGGVFWTDRFRARDLLAAHLTD